MIGPTSRTDILLRLLNIALVDPGSHPERTRTRTGRALAREGNLFQVEVPFNALFPPCFMATVIVHGNVDVKAGLVYTCKSTCENARLQAQRPAVRQSVRAPIHDVACRRPLAPCQKRVRLGWWGDTSIQGTRQIRRHPSARCDRLI